MRATVPIRWAGAVLALVLLATACGADGGQRATTDDPLLDVIESGPGERTVQVVSADRVRLFGTLNVPPSAGDRGAPGVLLVPSTSPGDRNGVTRPTGDPDNIGRELAETLAAAGLVTYRYDGRGTGESRLDDGATRSFDALVADARAALDLLADRRETGDGGFSVVGYGPGGLVALRLAATDERVRRLVLIGVPGRSLVDVQAAELQAAYGPESADALRRIVAELVTTRTLPALDAMPAELRPLLPPGEAAFLADLYSVDPAVDAARARARALIVVPRDGNPYEADRLAGLIAGAEVLRTDGGPTMEVLGPPPDSDPSDPNSPVHDHSTTTPVIGSERDPEALERLTRFLTA